MKQISIVFSLLLTTISVFGQKNDTTFYDSAWFEVSTLQNATYYDVTYKSMEDTNNVKELTYYQSGQIRNETYFSDYENNIKEGNDKQWFFNSKLKSEIKYTKNIKDGFLLTFWQNGNPKRIDSFNNGNFINGKCFDSLGNEIKHFDYLIKAKFIGGDKKFSDYILKNLNPQTLNKSSDQSEVVLNFQISKNGIVTNVEVIKSANVEFDAEAVKLLSNSPPWEPALEDGESIDSYRKLPIIYGIEEN